MVAGLSLLWSEPTMRRAVALLFVSILALRAFNAEAFHYITPPLLQIPPVGQSPGTIQHPHWGGLRFVLFDSDADLLNTSSTGRQIFVFDLQARDVQGALALTQVTSSPVDDSQRARTGRRAVMIAYDAQPGGTGPRQLMLVDRRTGVHNQLTAGTGDSINPTVDDGERVIVFESSADFFNTGATGSQIYRIDLRKTFLGCPFPCAQTGNAGLTQLTSKSGTNKNAVTSNSGKTIVFESDADLLNVGQTENQVYLYDGKSGVTSRLTHGPGASRNPTVTRDGGRLVFESDANLTGSGTGGTQLYLYRRTKHTLEQLTNATGGACTKPAISSNGHAVAFLSSNDLLNLGSSGPEVYSYDLKKNYLLQLTNAPGDVSNPAYASGVFTVFLADGDLAGNGSPGKELQLVNLYALAGQTVP
jgi:Tol biopolymer transport system component